MATKRLLVATTFAATGIVYNGYQQENESLFVSVRRNEDCKSFKAPHGEIIEEMFGDVVGGTETHSLAKCTIPFGKKALIHYHPQVEESYYILSGDGEMHYCKVQPDHLKMDENERKLHKNEIFSYWNKNKEIKKVTAGDAIAIPKNNWHQMQNNEKENLIFVVTCVPSWTPQCAINLPQ